MMSYIKNLKPVHRAIVLWWPVSLALFVCTADSDNILVPVLGAAMFGLSTLLLKLVPAPVDHD